MELAVRLEEYVGRRPDFIVDPAARGIFRYLEDQRIRDQLRHVLVEQVLRLFDESAIVCNNEDVTWQYNIALNADK